MSAILPLGLILNLQPITPRLHSDETVEVDINMLKV